MSTIRVLVADDEEAVRLALAELVDSDPDMDLVAQVSNTDEAITAALETQPDVALVDVKMPGGGGPRAAREIVAGCPGTRVVALSAYEDRRTVLDMLRAGVVGYLVKGTPATEILRTIRRTVKGEGSLSVEITADVIRELAELLDRSELLAHQLQELDRTKSELVQLMSHELFTPVTTIQGFALTVSEHGDRLTPDDIRELAGGVSRASHRLRRLIGNLAVAARLDREGVEITTRPVAVGDVVTRATASFSGAGERIDVAEDPAMLGERIWADPELAAQAIVIALENALEFGGDQPVRIDVDADGETVQVHVIDRGSGIAEHTLPHVFDAFTQGDPTSTRAHEGLGIGLYLARRIMRAHGGDVVAATSGDGTTMTFSFSGVDAGRA